MDAYDRERDDRLDFPPDTDRDDEVERRWFGGKIEDGAGGGT